MKISTCCGAPAKAEGAEEIGICPECLEHCEFEEEFAEHELDEGDNPLGYVNVDHCIRCGKTSLSPQWDEPCNPENK